MFWTLLWLALGGVLLVGWGLSGLAAGLTGLDDRRTRRAREQTVALLARARAADATRKWATIRRRREKPRVRVYPTIHRV